MLAYVVSAASNASSMSSCWSGLSWPRKKQTSSCFDIDLDGCEASSLAGTSPLLFVFDFDETIASYHVWGHHQNKALDEVPIDDATFVDLIAFKNFVKWARSRGHSVAIATFGRKDVANKAMTHALGEEHGVVISTPADHNAAEGTSQLRDKNTQLRALAQRFEMQLSQLYFFDDSQTNVKKATDISVRATWTPDGLTQAVLTQAKLSSSGAIEQGESNMLDRLVGSLSYSFKPRQSRRGRATHSRRKCS